MSRSVEAFKVFIASPGDLEKERTAVRDEIRTFTDSYMHEYGAAFSSEGWEDVPGGLRRAQAAINEVVESCDYMILILGSRWGTPPDKDKNYTSGTEEEFHLAKKCIEGADSPMRDVLVLFKGIPDAQLGDPGPQLKRVLKFKAELERSKEILYKTFDDLESLRHEARSRLRGWAQPPGGLAAGQAGEPDDRPLGQTGSTSPAAPTDQGLTELESEASPLEVAAQYEAKGQVTQAEAAYARAIVDLDVPSLEKYARFLRRTSRLSKSLEVNREILNQLASTRDPRQTTAERARVLTSIGIVERKLGNLIASRRSLQEAIQTAREGAPETVEALAYALDNLGITVDRSGDSEEAIALFTEALEARRGSGELAGQARSLTNLARVLKRHGDVEEAERSCRRAIELLNELDDRPALASAHAAMGEILDLKDDVEGAEASYRSALALNESLARPDGIAMSLIQVARSLVEKNELVEAERYATRALAENEATSNREGLVASTHLLGRIYAETGRENSALALLEDAVSSYSKINNPNGEGWARYHLAVLQRKMGRDAEAAQSLERVRSLAERTGNAKLLALATA